MTMRLAGRTTLLVLAAAMLSPHLAVSSAGAATSPGSQDRTAPASPVITFPRDGGTVPTGDLDVRGTLSVAATPTATSATPAPSGADAGSGAPATTVVYVVDVSGSTDDVSGLDCNGDGARNARDDANGDGRSGDILDCEIAGIVAINRSISRPDVAVGLVAFGRTAAVADLTPGARDDALISPPDRDTLTGADKRENDLTTVATSLRQGRVGAFTEKAVGTETDFDAALRATVTALDAAPAGPVNVFFLSDGAAAVNSAGPLRTLADRPDTTLNAFQIGGRGGCASGQPLATIDAADGTAGCREVEDPAALSAAATAPKTGVVLDVTLQPTQQTVRASVDAIGDWHATFPGVPTGNYAAEAVATYGDGTRTRSSVRFEVVEPSGSSYRGGTGTRLLDTRTALNTPLRAGQSTVLRVAGRGGVPAGASAAVLNLTAVNASAPGFVTAWPTGTGQPPTSSLNVTRKGQTVAALVTVPLGPDGSVQLYSERGGHLLVDLQGWYQAETGPVSRGRFVGMTPKRLLDTRLTAVKVLPAGGSTTARLSSAGVPTDATAVALNLTMDKSRAAGFVTATTGDAGRTSNLNVDRRGQTVANMAIVPVTSDLLRLTTSSGGALIADVVGYYTGAAASASTSGLFRPVKPVRVLDTRTLGRSRLPGAVVPVAVAPALRLPAEAVAAITGTITLVGPSGPGFVTAWPADLPRPTVSNLNAGGRGDVVAGHLQLRTDRGRLQVYLQSGGHLVVDATGYFRP